MRASRLRDARSKLRPEPSSFMQNITDSDSRSPPQTGGVVTRAQSDSANDTAQPSLTSGFGAVIQKEYDLRTATEESRGQVSGHRALDMDRILRHQHSRLGANIALLEQRYEALPNPERFVTWGNGGNAPSRLPAAERYNDGILPGLIELHTTLRGDIEALIGCAADGQRGELILTEVSRSHEEMAWTLIALLKEDESMARLTDNPAGSGEATTRRAQERWDNEGGHVRATPPIN